MLIFCMILPIILAVPVSATNLTEQLKTEMIKNAVTGEFSDVKINLLGPLQPRVSKISNKYRNIITIKCKNNKRFREMMAKLLKEYMKNAKYSTANVTIDINPLS